MVIEFKSRSIFKDIFLTFITNILMLVCVVFIYRLIAKNFGPDGLGEYSLIRTILAFFIPLIFLGLGIGLPRYIAMAQDKRQRSYYLKTGTTVVMSSALVFILLINLFKEDFTKIFFGNIGYINLVLPFSILFVGIVVHSIFYFYFQGRLFVRKFNLLQLLNLSFLPISILIFFKNISLEILIALIGIGTFLITFAFCLKYTEEIFIPIKKIEFKNSLRTLLSYSLPRIPGDFAAVSFFSLGPIFAAHFASIKEVGYISISQSLLSASVAAVVGPLGLILLPKVSNLIVQKKQETIEENVNYLIGAIFQCFIFVCIQLIIFTDTIITYWLGPEFLLAVPVMRFMFISSIFYAFYLTMKNILDAAEVKPINTINFYLSLSVFLLISFILLFLFTMLTPIISLSIGFTSGLICLGVLTYFSIRKIYPGNRNKDLNHLLIAISVNILLGVIAVVSKPYIISKLYWLIFFEVLVGLIYLWILWRLKTDWIKQIYKMI